MIFRYVKMLKDQKMILGEFGNELLYLAVGNAGADLWKRTRCPGRRWRPAGAMAYFTNGYSDSNRSTNPDASLTLVKCLNIIPYCFCPHYNDQERKTFDEFVKVKNFEGLALEDNTALLYIDDKIQGVIKSNTNNTGYYIINGKKEEINDANTR